MTYKPQFRVIDLPSGRVEVVSTYKLVLMESYIGVVSK